MNFLLEGGSLLGHHANLLLGDNLLLSRRKRRWYPSASDERRLDASIVVRRRSGLTRAISLRAPRLRFPRLVRSDDCKNNRHEGLLATVLEEIGRKMNGGTNEDPEEREMALGNFQDVELRHVPSEKLSEGTVV